MSEALNFDGHIEREFHRAPQPRNGKPQPPTLVISRHVHLDKVGAYEAWLREITVLASEHAGFMGLTVVRPSRDGEVAEFVMAAHFDTDENLALWMVSPLRSRLMIEAEEFSDRPAEAVCEPGIDYWFTPHDGPMSVAGVPAGSVAAPPRWKMASVLTVLIFLLSQGLMRTLVPLFGPAVPLWAVQFAALSIQITLLTYWMLPRLTRLLAFWLSPIGERR